jgi:hypothetical protein
MRSNPSLRNCSQPTNPRPLSLSDRKISRLFRILSCHPFPENSLRGNRILMPPSRKMRYYSGQTPCYKPCLSGGSGGCGTPCNCRHSSTSTEISSIQTVPSSHRTTNRPRSKWVIAMGFRVFTIRVYPGSPELSNFFLLKTFGQNTKARMGLESPIRPDRATC